MFKIVLSLISSLMLLSGVFANGVGEPKYQSDPKNRPDIKVAHHDALQAILKKQAHRIPLTPDEQDFFEKYQAGSRTEYNTSRTGISPFNVNNIAINSQIESDSVTIKWRTPYFNNPSVGNTRFVDAVIDSASNSYHLYITTLLPFGNDISLIKYDSNGEQIWLRRIGESFSKHTYAKALAIDSANYIYVCGEIKSVEFSKNDILVAKYDQQGNSIWAYRYNSENNANDIVLDVAIDRNTIVVLSGENRAGNNNETWLKILKFNNGQPQVTHYTEPDSAILYPWSSPVYLNIDNKSNFIISTKDMISKYTASGDRLWSKKCYELFAVEDQEISIYVRPRTDNNGNTFIITTRVYNGENELLTAKINATGQNVWTSRLNTNRNERNLFIGKSGAIYAIADYDYIAIVKYDSSGNLEWLIDDKDKKIRSGLITIDTDENIFIFDVIRNTGEFVKINSQGTIEWTTQAFRADNCTLKIANNKTFLLAGGDGTGFLRLYDQLGNFKKEARFTGFDAYFSSLNAARMSPDGGIIIAGYTNTPTLFSYSQRLFITKISRSGLVEWTATEDDLGHCCVDIADLRGDKDGNTYVSTALVEEREVYPYLIKYDKDGNRLWKNKVESAGGGYSKKIALDKNNNSYIATAENDSDYYRNLFVIKYTELGKLKWKKKIGNSFYSYPHYMHLDPVGNLVLVGRFSTGWENGGIYIIKINPSGQIVTDNQFVTERNYFSGIHQDKLGNLIVAQSEFDGENFYAHVYKFNYYGQFLWKSDDLKISSSEEHYIRRVQTDASNNIFILLGPITSYYTVPKSFLIKMTQHGDIILSTIIDGSANSFAGDRSGNSFVLLNRGTLNKIDTQGRINWSHYLQTGYNTNLSRIMLSDSTDIIIPFEQSGYNYSFFEVIKLKQNLTSEELYSVSNLSDEASLEQNFPNPFNGITHVRYSIKKPGNVDISVFNNLGQRIKTLVNEFQVPQKYITHWVPQGVPSGTYFIRIKAKGFNKTKRVLYLK